MYALYIVRYFNSQSEQDYYFSIPEKIVRVKPDPFYFTEKIVTRLLL